MKRITRSWKSIWKCKVWKVQRFFRQTEDKTMFECYVGNKLQIITEWQRPRLQ